MRIEQPRPVPRRYSHFLRDAALTGAAVVLAFGALDDITTDRSTTFVVERTALACCGVWLLFVAWRLVRGGRRVLGAVSAIAVAAAAVAQPAIGQGMEQSYLPYLVTIAVLAWFLVLAGILATFARRVNP
jgi:peptidoglycan/LPS O-acetylase OafA/YrhL